MTPTQRKDAFGFKIDSGEAKAIFATNEKEMATEGSQNVPNLHKEVSSIQGAAQVLLVRLRFTWTERQNEKEPSCKAVRNVWKFGGKEGVPCREIEPLLLLQEMQRSVSTQAVRWKRQSELQERRCSYLHRLRKDVQKLQQGKEVLRHWMRKQQKPLTRFSLRENGASYRKEMLRDSQTQGLSLHVEQCFAGSV